MPGRAVSSSSGGGGDAEAGPSNSSKGPQNGEIIVSGLTNRLFRREGPYPPLHFPLGGDVFLSPFLGMVSIRKYICYRSPMMYPSGYGRTFTLDQWRTLIKYMKNITEAIYRHAPDEMRYDLTDQGCYLVTVKSNLVDGDPPLDRGVVFVQEGREDFVLAPVQWQQLIKRARCFLIPGVLTSAPPPPPLLQPPPPPPPPATVNKRQQGATAKKKRMTKKQLEQALEQKLLTAAADGREEEEEEEGSSKRAKITGSLTDATSWNEDSHYWLTPVSTPDVTELIGDSPPLSPPPTTA